MVCEIWSCPADQVHVPCFIVIDIVTVIDKDKILIRETIDIVYLSSLVSLDLSALLQTQKTKC